MTTEDELRAARAKHATELRQAGRAPFPNDFVGDDGKRAEVVRLANDPEAREALPGEGDIAPDAAHYPLYGRVMAKRGPFVVIQTPHGRAQALVRPDNLPADEARQLKTMDLADHVAVSGPLMKTRTGELAVRAAWYRHLAKAMLPPPSKWHGLSDVEKRYRERYVDLFANPEVAQVFRARTLVTQQLRRFLDDRGFIEVETPILQPVRGGATARPFRTHHNALDMPLYLRVAPELYLKRLLVGGMDRVYELGRVFRNEGVSTKHNPEFTILELYAAYTTYEDLMNLTELMLREVDERLRERFPALTAERPFELDEDWPRVSMRDAIVERMNRAGRGEVSECHWAAQLDRDTVYDPERLARVCAEIEQRAPEDLAKALRSSASYGGRLVALYEWYVEQELPNVYRSQDGQRALPVFVTQHPIEVSPLARRNDQDPAFTDRFELILLGKEMANAFSELNDPDDQAARFREQVEHARAGDEEAMEYDADYIRALSHGLPPAAGFGLGVDRLVMALCGQPSIRDVLLFPLMKPEAT